MYPAKTRRAPKHIVSRHTKNAALRCPVASDAANPRVCAAPCRANRRVRFRAQSLPPCPARRCAECDRLRSPKCAALCRTARAVLPRPKPKTPRSLRFMGSIAHNAGKGNLFLQFLLPPRRSAAPNRKFKKQRPKHLTSERRRAILYKHSELGA